MKPYQPTLTEKKRHFDLEKKLADSLRQATAAERQKLYGQVYDEIYAAIPYLLPNQRILSQLAIADTLNMLRPYLRPQTTYLEIGAGNCVLALEAAKRVAQVYAVDVSVEVTADNIFPKNFTLSISDGLSIPVPEGSIDLAFSNQLMEHLHPDDAAEQLSNIYRALKPGGRYICITPNHWSGPHDISKYFTPSATGFHLREYDHGQLVSVFRQAGFRHFRALIGSRGLFVEIPLWPLRALESCLAALPFNLGVRLGRLLPLRLLLGIKLIARR